MTCGAQHELSVRDMTCGAKHELSVGDMNCAVQHELSVGVHVPKKNYVLGDMTSGAEEKLCAGGHDFWCRRRIMC